MGSRAFLLPKMGSPSNPGRRGRTHMAEFTRKWVRTCQSCNHKKVADTEPVNKYTPAYTEATCRKCKSESYDYGSWRNLPAHAS